MKNIIKLREVTTVCCVCGEHISGPWAATPDLSHGYCQVHHLLAMQEIERYLALLDRRLQTGAIQAQAA